ncbi:hypothetical protein BDV93DRAFT_525679 [Ceratobasidium sp. AG-I]|nr:hypothetical protein BDV93DRAFT_525679 [Ceratobasidium sp. AG-I]
MGCEVTNSRMTTDVPGIHVERSGSVDGPSTPGVHTRQKPFSRLSRSNLSFTTLKTADQSPASDTRVSHSGRNASSPSSPTCSPPRSRRGSRASSPSGRRDGKHSPKLHAQRRSCPSSPSASFVSSTPFHDQTPTSSRYPTAQQPTYQRTRSRSNTSSSHTALNDHPAQGFYSVAPTPAPVCIRSRSSSHPHLPSYGSSVLPQAAYAGLNNKNATEILGSSQRLHPASGYSSTGAGTARASSSASPSSPSAPFFSQAVPRYLATGTRTMDVDNSDGEQEPIIFGRQLHHGSGSIGRIRSRTHLQTGHATETETEREGPPRVLPTARGPAHHQPSATPLMSRCIPLLMLSFRLLAIVPATIGTVINAHNVVHPPENTSHTRIDFAVTACWSVLTGFQCWFLTCGLLQRWRAYYPLLSTLVRLLALQAICWPATHLTLSILDVDKRPAACWAVVGTTTSVSRAIQLWATSNLGPMERGQRVIYGRKWDWGEVALKCGFPCFLVYFVMAWGAVFNRELGLC